ncbi:MAG: hypothetical protein H7Y88_05000 [Phycisphaerales bacterium]|nr:hypothetical protein [Phycisphaerales bacterium]
MILAIVPLILLHWATSMVMVDDARMAALAASPTSFQQVQSRAVLDALLAYERSIDSIWWEQTSYLPPDAGRHRSEWVVLEVSERAVASDWSFLHLSKHRSCGAPDWIAEYDQSLFFGDATHRVTWGVEADQNSGMFTQPDHFFSGSCNIARLLGRFTEYAMPMRGRSLGEELTRATNLEYLAPTTEAPWPGLRCKGVASGGGLHVEVRVDPVHGFAPRTILLFRSMDDMFAEGLIVLDYSLIDGVWMPRVGIQGTMYAEKVPDVENPLSQQRVEDFAAAATMKGLPIEIQTPELQKWIRRFHEVSVLDADQSLATGPLICFNTNEQLYSPQIMIVGSCRVNEAPDRDQLFSRIPATAKMFNGMTGAWTDTAGVQRIVETLGLPDVPEIGTEQK